MVLENKHFEGERGLEMIAHQKQRLLEFLKKNRNMKLNIRTEAQVGRQRRTSRPLQSRKSRACHAKGAEPRWDASGVHHAPCRAESRAPATQKARSPGGTPAAYITPTRLPRKKRGAQVSV